MNKRAIAVTLAGAMMLAVAGTGCGNSASSSRVVNVYNWGEYIDEDIFDSFEEQTGIQVNYKTYSDNESMYSVLKSGSTEYDVIIPSDYMIARLIEEDMLETLDFDNIPNYANISEDYKNLDYDPDNAYSVPYMWGTTGIIYNTTMVSEAPTSWDVLWDESLSGQILMFDNSRDAVAIALLRLGYDLNTSDAAQITEAVDLLVEQKPVLQAYVMDQIFDKMEGGEAAVAPYYAGDAITMIEENPDLAFVVPEEGANLFVDAMCIPKGAENKTEAEEFINFMCSDEACLANCDVTGYSTPSTTALAAMDEEMRSSEIAYPASEILSRCQTFTNLPQDTLSLYDEQWLRLKTD